MSKTDFFDDDLIKLPDHENPSSLNPGRIPAAEGKPAEVTLRHLARQRDVVEKQLASTQGEIERLRQQREDRAKDREELEGILKKQDEYEHCKKDVVDRMTRSLMALEKEEVRTVQLAEVYGNTRQRFAKMLSEVEDLDETTWSEAEFHEELAAAQLLLDSVRLESVKLLKKVQAVQTEAAEISDGDLREINVRPAVSHPGFGYWLKVGIALSIPLLLTLSAAGLLVYLAATRWL